MRISALNAIRHLLQHGHIVARAIGKGNDGTVVLLVQCEKETHFLFLSVRGLLFFYFKIIIMSCGPHDVRDGDWEALSCAMAAAVRRLLSVPSPCGSALYYVKMPTLWRREGNSYVREAEVCDQFHDVPWSVVERIDAAGRFHRTKRERKN